MLKILLIVGILLALAGGLIYFRVFKTNTTPVSPATSGETLEVTSSPMEVPKNLPTGSVEDKINTVQESLSKVVDEINKIKSQNTSQNVDTRLKGVEAAVTDLKVRVSSLEKGGSSTTNKPATVYIPLGSGGQAGDRNWINIDNYGISIDPAEYPGYASMQLEVNFRLTQKSGTGYARLISVADGSAISSEVSTTLDTLGWQTSSTFKLPSGKKSYTLQTKSTEGVDIQIESARIKVNY